MQEQEFQYSKDSLGYWLSNAVAPKYWLVGSLFLLLLIGSACFVACNYQQLAFPPLAVSVINCIFSLISINLFLSVAFVGALAIICFILYSLLVFSPMKHYEIKKLVLQKFSQKFGKNRKLQALNLRIYPYKLFSRGIVVVSCREGFNGNFDVLDSEFKGCYLYHKKLYLCKTVKDCEKVELWS